MSTQRVLFACTHNSARSQMAEAMLRRWGGDKFEAFSAGTEASGIKPETFQVMNEIGIDISNQRSKTVDEFRGRSFEWFITVCDEAQQNCPSCPALRIQPTGASKTRRQCGERPRSGWPPSGTRVMSFAIN
jgi:arsenate reductase (thioredoxin)